jgi:hypothetical protein
LIAGRRHGHPRVAGAIPQGRDWLCRSAPVTLIDLD